MANNGIEKIKAAFAKHGKIKLMTHIIGGFPSLEESEKIVREMIRGGADIVEVQIPFSDPTADGPVISEANVRALATGVSTAEVIEMCGRLAGNASAPILVMTYLNPVHAYGIERFVSDCASKGIAGVIIPDCPPEDLGLVELCNRAGIAFVPLVAPSTNEARMKYLGSVSDSPFVYAVTRLGVTGKKTDIGSDVGGYCEKVARATGKLVAAGFGIRDREQVKSLEGKAACAIVGSAVTTAVKNAVEANIPADRAAFDFVSSLR
jgi:tryptophan synthase alpha chain